MPINNAPVIGTDGKNPLYNPEGLFRVWSIDEIFVGAEGENKYVPNVGDLVIEISNNIKTEFIVHSVDSVTYIAVLLPVKEAEETHPFTDDDLIIGTTSDQFRVYLNKDTTPYTLEVDKRLRVGGVQSTYFQLFKGVNIYDPTKIVSGMYDLNGQLLTQSIPLELAISPSIINTTYKIFPTCFTTFNLEEGEVLYAVVYNNSNQVVTKKILIVEHSTAIVSSNIEKKYVADIRIATPFLSNVNQNLIEFPINVQLNTLNLNGIVVFSDGSEVTLPVNGSKFSIFGLQDYTASLPGQDLDIVLKYRLDPGEEALNVNLGNSLHVSKQYTIRTISTNASYSVKLFTYPVWNNSNNNYQLKWFIYDLDRGLSQEVTPNVVIDPTYSTFIPSLYGSKQSLRAIINLNNVNGIYNSFNYVQLVDITLNKPGTDRPTDSISNWLVDNTLPNGLVFGNGIYLTYYQETVTTWKVRLSSSITDFSVWLQKIYKNTNPIVNNLTEVDPITPTHFQLIVNGVIYEREISYWNTQLIINTGPDLNGSVFVKFINSTPTKDLQLSVAGLPAYQVDVNNNFI